MKHDMTTRRTFASNNTLKLLAAMSERLPRFASREVMEFGELNTYH